MCTSNETDNEGSEVFNRLINCIDFVQMKHVMIINVGFDLFSTSLLAGVSDKKGRPVIGTRIYYFEKVWELLERKDTYINYKSFI